MAYALVSGSTYAMTGAIGAIDSSAKSGAAAGASMASTGNVSLGNDSLNNYGANKMNSAVQDVSGTMPRVRYDGFVKNESSPGHRQFTDNVGGATLTGVAMNGGNYEAMTVTGPIGGSSNNSNSSTTSTAYSTAQSHLKTASNSVSNALHLTDSYLKGNSVAKDFGGGLNIQKGVVAGIDTKGITTQSNSQGTAFATKGGGNVGLNAASPKNSETPQSVAPGSSPEEPNEGYPNQPVKFNGGAEAGANVTTTYQQEINKALANSGNNGQVANLANNLQKIMKNDKNFAHNKTFEKGFNALESYSNAYSSLKDLKKTAQVSSTGGKSITGASAVKAVNNLDRVNAEKTYHKRYSDLSHRQQKAVMIDSFQEIEHNGTYAQRKALVNKYSGSNINFTTPQTVKKTIATKGNPLGKNVDGKIQQRKDNSKQWKSRINSNPVQTEFQTAMKNFAAYKKKLKSETNIVPVAQAANNQQNKVIRSNERGAFGNFLRIEKRTFIDPALKDLKKL